MLSMRVRSPPAVATTSIIAQSRPKESRFADRLGVNGGTAWAIQMYYDQWSELRTAALELPTTPSCKIFFYDQDVKTLYVLQEYTKTWLIVNWVIEKPSGIYAAIGTRKLNAQGKAFIDELYNR